MDDKEKKQSMKSTVFITFIIIIGIPIFLLSRCMREPTIKYSSIHQGKEQEEGLEYMAKLFKAKHIELYENNYGQFIKIESNVKDNEKIYKMCKKAIPKMLDENIQKTFPDAESFIIVSKALPIAFNFNILDKIDWDKAKDFNSLSEQVEILKIRNTKIPETYEKNGVLYESVPHEPDNN